MNNSVKAKHSSLNHIAFIMDGNGRWAKARNKPRTYGHEVAIKNLMPLIEECGKLGIHNVSLFAFSTENWKRPKSEINMLFNYLERFLKQNEKKLIKNHIRLYVSGDYHQLPKSCVKAIDHALLVSKKEKVNRLNVCLNYGGQDEIIMVTNKLIKRNVKKVTKEIFEKELYASDLGPIDLLIRTSGEVRISNFMLYNLAYSEMIFYKKPFPDFKNKDLHLCVKEFNHRHRRYGGLKNE